VQRKILKFLLAPTEKEMEKLVFLQNIRQTQSGSRWAKIQKTPQELPIPNLRIYSA
jgi:hypothetical protein